MLKKNNQFFLSCQVIMDALLVIFAWLTTKSLLDQGKLGNESAPGTQILAPGGTILDLQIYTPQLDLSVLGLPHWITIASLLFCFYRAGLYKSFRNDTRFSDIWCILKGLAWFIIPALLLTRLYQELWIPVNFGLCFAGITFLSIALFRFIERTILKHLRTKGFNQRHLLIVGAKRGGQELVEKIKRCRWMGFHVVGFIDDNESLQGTVLSGVPVLGKISELPDILGKHDIDQVYCALPFNEMDKTLIVADILTRFTADFRVVPDMVSLSSLNSSLFDIDGLPILGVRESPLQGFNVVQKRIFDITFSLFALIMLSPLMLTIAAIIKLTSKGPVFFRQKRVGWDGETFTIFKFRTMPVEQENEAHHVWGQAKKKKCTPFGRLLRITSLDELPQFFNVLAGTMSVVGPRPELPEYAQAFSNDIPKYMLRHKTKAGITGWAQVNGWRGDTSIKKRVQYDLYYIENWSLWFDLRIVVDTLFRGLSKNAY